MQHAFSFAGMPKLIFGPDGAGRLGELAAAFGHRALLLSGAGALERSGNLARIQDTLQAAGVTFRHRCIAGEPSPAVVDGIVDAFRGASVDMVIAVGGGSVLDAGKAIAAMLKEDGSVVDFLEGVGRHRPSGLTLPMVAVPTTSGTGSEATKNAVISRIGGEGFKKSLRHDNYIPRVAVVDPTLCATAPPTVTAACGMDALTQLIESYVSPQASPLTDALATSGMARLIPALPRACSDGSDDVDCRGDVAYGAFLSGVTLAHAGLGVVHGVAGPMGGLVAVPHGVACANLLPGAVEATIDNLKAAGSPSSTAVIEKYAWIGRCFGGDYREALDSCRHLVECLYGWLDRLAIPRLGRFGLSRGHVDRLVQSAGCKNNPLPLSAAQLERMILNRC